MIKDYLKHDFEDDLKDKLFIEYLSLNEKFIYYNILEETEWNEEKAQNVFETVFTFNMEEIVNDWDDSILKDYGYNITIEELDKMDYEDSEEIIKDILSKENHHFLIVSDIEPISSFEVCYQLERGE